ncbi:MAG: hypothetical protein AAGF97_18785, partial [Planctomycetota bacterium]
PIQDEPLLPQVRTFEPLVDEALEPAEAPLPLSPPLPPEPSEAPPTVDPETRFFEEEAERPMSQHQAAIDRIPTEVPHEPQPHAFGTTVDPSMPGKVAPASMAEPVAGTEPRTTGSKIDLAKWLEQAEEARPAGPAHARSVTPAGCYVGAPADQ